MKTMHLFLDNSTWTFCSLPGLLSCHLSLGQLPCLKAPWRQSMSSVSTMPETSLILKNDFLLIDSSSWWSSRRHSSAPDGAADATGGRSESSVPWEVLPEDSKLWREIIGLARPLLGGPYLQPSFLLIAGDDLWLSGSPVWHLQSSGTRPIKCLWAGTPGRAPCGHAFQTPSKAPLEPFLVKKPWASVSQSCWDENHCLQAKFCPNYIGQIVFVNWVSFWLQRTENHGFIGISHVKIKSWLHYSVCPEPRRSRRSDFSKGGVAQ